MASDALAALREAMLRLQELEQRLKDLEAKIGLTAQLAGQIVPGGNQ